MKKIKKKKKIVQQNEEEPSINEIKKDKFYITNIEKNWKEEFRELREQFYETDELFTDNIGI